MCHDLPEQFMGIRFLRDLLRKLGAPWLGGQLERDQFAVEGLISIFSFNGGENGNFHYYWAGVNLSACSEDSEPISSTDIKLQLQKIGQLLYQASTFENCSLNMRLY